MANQLTQKEKTLLSDQLSHEELCVKKYSSYADQVSDPQVKNMFKQFAQEEQNHYNTISGFLAGQIPGQTGKSAAGQTGQAAQAGLTSPGAQGGQSAQMGQGTQAGQGTQVGISAKFGGGQAGAQGAAGQGEAQGDAGILQDMLMTEKYVSSTYNTAIFETLNPSIRQSLRHIQEDEQKHGEAIAKYMQEHGMYQVQQ